MTVRVCAEPGCPTLTRKTRCHAHERARDKTRGTSTERGYDYAHQLERAEWQRRLDADEPILCRRAPSGQCGAASPLIDRDPSSWDLGHPDGECLAPKSPEHAGTCNRATSGRLSSPE